MTSAPIGEGQASCLTLAEASARIATHALQPGPVGRVGIELEAHVVDTGNPDRRVPWPTLQAIVRRLPVLPGASRITFEPGGQVELSGPPAPDITTAVAALRTDSTVLRAAFAEAGLALALMGRDPLRAPQRVNPAVRYAAMEQHFASVGCAAAGTAMMTSTASLQVNLEAGPPQAWGRRVALAHQLGPVLVAVSACSPLATGRAVGWRSGRQQVWGDLDQARCGPLLGGDDPAGEWANYALAAPVMLVRDAVSGSADPVCGRVPFADWITGAAPLAGRRPTSADLDYHLSTLFPPVRPRGYLEIRYLDAAPEPWWPALAAITSALLDDPLAADRAAAATEAVAGAWSRAAHLGLADPGLHAAARSCLDAALGAVPAALRPEVEALAELVDRGASPGDALLRTALEGGAAAALLTATRTPEAAP
ncbi:glutamate--cysteine ligase [Blastococcus sp. DSM 46786]|uniref:ergothioneine biosynthesis glutamate--cysteine ligase EgtA n=1 Tax=Blastococcus sp. DSM 46786 TaxID=1798227 RepID=UPI0008D336FA|nr:ergothioneine biosynthesis glutamate--cysteine ligase EgtA [Blastococcus sp. DSM 46786]SEM01943.1 glutamate--cysteine ligase [Blastococcus sp. DSM 46786]